MRADTLNRRSDYKAQKRVTATILRTNDDYLKVTETTEEQLSIIKECHDPQTIEHMGIIKIIDRVRERDNWEGIKKDITEYIANCPVYAKAKYIRKTKEEQHQALEAPKHPFQRPALDFITGLPEADDPATGKNYNIIITIVDGLTKYAKFISYRTDIDARQLTYI